FFLPAAPPPTAPLPRRAALRIFAAGDSALHFRRRADAARRHIRAADLARLVFGGALARRFGASERGRLDIVRRRLGLGAGRCVGDRKSARLNSGQVKSSYGDVWW